MYFTPSFLSSDFMDLIMYILSHHGGIATSACVLIARFVYPKQEMDMVGWSVGYTLMLWKELFIKPGEHRFSIHLFSDLINKTEIIHKINNIGYFTSRKITSNIELL